MLPLFIILALAAAGTALDIWHTQRFMQASLARIEEMHREIAALLAADQC